MRWRWGVEARRRTLGQALEQHEQEETGETRSSVRRAGAFHSAGKYDWLRGVEGQGWRGEGGHKKAKGDEKGGEEGTCKTMPPPS